MQREMMLKGSLNGKIQGRKAAVLPAISVSGVGGVVLSLY